MKEYTKEELKQIYKTRRSVLAAKLRETSTGACVFIDCEEHRDPAVPYYTNHPTDAVLIIFSDGYTVLVPWDENLAKQNAFYDKLVPYTRYKNKDIDATKAVLNVCYTHGENSKVELPPYLTYPEYLRFIDELANYDCRCKEDGIHKFVMDCRMIKDEYEIECTREAARVGDLIIDEIEKLVKKDKIKTEADVALLIENACVNITASVPVLIRSRRDLSAASQFMRSRDILPHHGLLRVFQFWTLALFTTVTPATLH